ncbi:AraC family transcriptional regulator [Nitratireductor sp. ZSWI3]|uniref:AraC family transcriptional regulator n=1 Tax=Nitratireductor sp. ZSWI3 TaxID=2966359 RepID=UPI00214F9524|nr:AraC family transcriptional regulator [Nitratireductor sp. ZSWI3]MCR4265054.1 AraC family transcriptional regulator [Nitratireductor sp. ZSWI3]
MELTARRMDVPPGGGSFSLPRLAVGVFLVGQDTHRVAVGSDRKRLVPLPELAGWVLPPGISGVCEFDEAHSYLTVEFANSLLHDVGYDSRRHFEPAFGHLDPLLVQLVHRAVLEREGASTLYRETMDLALAAHLTRLVQPIEASISAIDDVRLRRAVGYLQDNLASDLSLEALAAEAAMSRFHFARAFRTTFGQSPLQYVIRQRIERAKILLVTTRVPIAEVAARVGYQDVSRFGRHFKRQVGVTPGAFRKH